MGDASVVELLMECGEVGGLKKHAGEIPTMNGRVPTKLKIDVAGGEARRRRASVSGLWPNERQAESVDKKRDQPLLLGNHKQQVIDLADDLVLPDGPAPCCPDGDKNGDSSDRQAQISR